MAEFARAAWPWVTMGIMVAVAVVKMNGNEKNEK